VHDLRFDHGAQRVVLQVQQLRHDQRLRVAGDSGNRYDRQARAGASPPALLRFD
jgi:hypothetical protein